MGTRILAVATEWRSRHGGLSTFNRQLCIALAAAGQQVVCLVPEAHIEDRLDAEGHGVTLLAAVSELAASESVRLRRRPAVGDLGPDVIIGHGRVTGSQARAIRDDFFPEARRVHVIHTYSGHIEWFKEPRPDRTRTQNAADREEHERFLAQDADVVAAVGPLLTREAAGMLQREVLQLLPGITTDPLKDSRPLPSTLRCLLAGRAEDKVLKGLDIAASAFGRLPQELSRKNPQLIIQGAVIADADELATELADMAGSRLKIHVAPYTDQPHAVALELDRATVAVMPSRREGFGLSGIEAISAGVPALVSANSGLGELMSELGGAAADCVVAVDDDLEADSRRWAERISEVLSDRKGAFARAAEVRRQIAAQCNWAATTRLLLEALGIEVPEVAALTPAAQPRAEVFKLPARAADFIGREELLESIEQRLAANSGGTIELLTGPPGVGKTVLATELAWRHREMYDVVWTLQAASPTAIASDLSALGRALGVAPDDSSPEEFVDAAQRWLAANTDWLLLVDDVSGFDELIEWIPDASRGDLLVTSRNAERWTGRGNHTRVGPFSRDDSIAYVLSRTGDPNPDQAAILAELLDDLPLALAMAVSYLDERGTQIRDLLEYLNQQSAVDDDGSLSTSIDNTLRVVRQELSGEALAVELFNLVAFYGSERIPQSLLREFLALPGAAGSHDDMTVYDRAIQAGLRFAVMFRQDGGFAVHPELSRRTRKELGEEANEWAAQACEIVLRVLGDASNEIAVQLVPHALAATGHAMQLGPPEGPAGDLYATVVRVRLLASRLLVASGQAQEAQQALDEVATFLERSQPRDEFDPVLSVAVSSGLADVMQAAGNDASAEAHRAAALAAARRTGVQPSESPGLSCQVLLDVMHAGSDSIDWYRALAFRALDTSGQVLAKRGHTDGASRAAAIELRLCIVGMLLRWKHFDDAVAATMPLLTDSCDGRNAEAFRTAAQLAARALNGLGDSTSAQELRDGT